VRERGTEKGRGEQERGWEGECIYPCASSLPIACVHSARQAFLHGTSCLYALHGDAPRTMSYQARALCAVDLCMVGVYKCSKDPWHVQSHLTETPLQLLQCRWCIGEAVIGGTSTP
jgi:hypothetical protein